MTTMNEELVSGLELKLERVARQVKASDLAAQIGVSRSYLSQLESRHSVKPEAAQRYRAGLATFPSLASHSESSSAA
jgi:transcriptional regulator with XRE-family HTH domain